MLANKLFNLNREYIHNLRIGKNPTYLSTVALMRVERLAFDSSNVVKKIIIIMRLFVRSLARMLHSWNVYAVSFVHTETHVERIWFCCNCDAYDFVFPTIGQWTENSTFLYMPLIWFMCMPLSLSPSSVCVSHRMIFFLFVTCVSELILWTSTRSESEHQW